MPVCLKAVFRIWTGMDAKDLSDHLDPDPQ
jgi:hypothetical protein